MQMAGIPFGTTDWATLERTEHKGETGTAYWWSKQFGDLRVRMVEYTPGYLADHWCAKGHVLPITPLFFSKAERYRGQRKEAGFPKGRNLLGL
jgi:hypothetical protein